MEYSHIIVLGAEWPDTVTITAMDRAMHFSSQKCTNRAIAPVEIAAVMAKCAHRSKWRRMFRHTSNGGVRRA
jgi:hypothetical protein